MEKNKWQLFYDWLRKYHPSGLRVADIYRTNYKKFVLNRVKGVKLSQHDKDFLKKYNKLAENFVKWQKKDIQIREKVKEARKKMSFKGWKKEYKNSIDDLSIDEKVEAYKNYTGKTNFTVGTNK